MPDPHKPFKSLRRFCQMGQSGQTEFLQWCQARAESTLGRLMPRASAHPKELHEAMRYAVLNGGKRVRPALVYAGAKAVGGRLEDADLPAAAVELIHAYSLVHDDLPAMDNDDLRRGKPTCHRAFGEATAILAGDALQALAFYILSHDPNRSLSAERRLQMIELLGFASGSRGMAGGQAIDLAATGKELSVVELEDMHIHKTGALIRASVLLGALCQPELDDKNHKNLDHFSKCVGLAFQIRDDILDVEGTSEQLGKTSGSDTANDKVTYVRLLGLDGARQRCNELYDDALASLADLGGAAEDLRWLARYFIHRIY